MEINAHIFRANDIRGVADVDLTDPLVRSLGRSYGTWILRHSGREVCVGRDCREHGNRLVRAFIGGVLETGLNVVDVGVVSSPMLYFAVHDLGCDGGVQITGSHNPADYNGFKMMCGKSSLHGDDIQALLRQMQTQDFESGAGKCRTASVNEAYVTRIAEDIQLGPHMPRVVIDGGNGTGGPPAMALMRQLGIEATGLYIEMDGEFPNHHPDPTVEANLVDLAERVRSDGADLGVAYDGDADRIGIVDEDGRVIWGDRLMIILARAVLEEHPGAAVVGEVKCSRTLFDAIASAGGRPVMSRVGHSIIKECMVKEDAMLAGEMSGHIFYRDRWYGFDDALYATARLLEVLSHHRGPISRLLDDVPVTSVTPEIRLPCSDDVKFELVDQAVDHFRRDYEVNDIDGARIDFSGGWGLIRASNTQPVIVMRVEAATDAQRDEIRGRIESFVLERTSSGAS